MHHVVAPGCAVVFAAALFAAGAPATAPGISDEPADSAERAPVGALRIAIEIIAVDGDGTRTLGENVADLFRGSTGVLEESVTLTGREGAVAPSEEVRLTTRLTLRDETGPFCPLLLRTEAFGSPAGNAAPGLRSDPDKRTARLDLEPGEPRIIQAYSSPFTRGRLALRVRCETAVPSGLQSDAHIFNFDVSLDRAEDDGPPRTLRTDRLTTTIGREASSLFSTNVPLPDDAEGEQRYRRERLEVRLAPQIFSGGKVQVTVLISGEIATISSSSAIERYELAASETVVLASRESGTIEVTARASDDAQGWRMVRYVIRVTGHF